MCAVHRSADLRRPSRLWNLVLLMLLIAVMIPAVLVLGVSGVVAAVTLILG